jgi:hypothetical protein
MDEFVKRNSDELVSLSRNVTVMAEHQEAPCLTPSNKP